MESLKYLGWRFRCPLCGIRLRSFAPDRWDGSKWHGARVRCPRCQSLPRHRFLWLYLDRQVLLRPDAAVLHVAPEPLLTDRVRRAVGRYVSVDIEPGRAEVEADLTALPFDDADFDLILCSHVLEHVPDDHAAVREMRRVLRATGTALIQTPVNYDQAVTYEDPSEADPEERLRRFSQADHVRVFGADLADRLGQVGFSVAVIDATSLGDAVEKNGLWPNAAPLRNDLYRCEARS